MRTNLRSPWLHQLNRSRPLATLRKPVAVDVAIVGAGIAGASTAYFLLKHTKKRVLLIEADRVAHGATGHNAGQLTSYFERPFHEMVEEFGLAMAAEGQQSVYDAWEHIAEMQRDLNLQTPCYAFTGYAGCLDFDELVSQLQDNALKHQAGIVHEEVFVADSFKELQSIPMELRHLYKIVPHGRILDMLETDDEQYIAALAGKKGCMNSARFTEELVAALLKKYRKRFQLAERTPVNVVRLYDNGAELVTPKHTLTAKRVVLCTNGFERMRIENVGGADIDTKFHHLVRGAVGYMAAFTEDPVAPPTAVSYLPKHQEGKAAFDADPYVYMTRRPYHRAATSTDLICVGGPEVLLDDTTHYDREHVYPEVVRARIDTFMRQTYRHAGKQLKYKYFWHGLMGFTPNGIRCVGEEPCNPVLMYNLGCNGVGILPSLMGSARVAKIVRGEKLAPSIFDPADRRCRLPVARRETPKSWVPPSAVWAFATCWAAVVSAVISVYWFTK